MPRITEVMSAAKYDSSLHDCLLPLYATPKIDGIRFYIQDGYVWSRSNKPIANTYIQQTLPLYLPNGVDGELVASAVDLARYRAAVDPEATAFQVTQSIVMGEYTQIDDMLVYCFDYVCPDQTPILGYNVRITYLSKWFQANNQLFLSGEGVAHGAARESSPTFIAMSAMGLLLRRLWNQTTILTPTALRKPSHIPLFLERCLAAGHEGIMLREPNSGYKFGRSTQKEALLLKHKPLEDAEAIIVGFEEGTRNDNPATISATGRTVRSSSQSGKVASNTLGNFLVELSSNRSVSFSIGAGIGLTHRLRKEIWSNQSAYLGRTIKFSYLAVGTKHLPRCPKFLGFRDEVDLPPPVCR